jgi:hypothetical protein
MGELTSYLSIAGLCYRQIAELKEGLAGEPQHFPTGEQTFFASEIACCEAIMATVRGILVNHFRLLEFSSDGKAIARIPPALLDLMNEEEAVISEN